MSEEIINNMKYGLAVSIFYGGKERGRCVQFTTNNSCYAQMTYKKAIKFLKEVIKKLEKEQ